MISGRTTVTPARHRIKSCTPPHKPRIAARLPKAAWPAIPKVGSAATNRTAGIGAVIDSTKEPRDSSGEVMRRCGNMRAKGHPSATRQTNKMPAIQPVCSKRACKPCPVTSRSQRVVSTSDVREYRTPTCPTQGATAVRRTTSPCAIVWPSRASESISRTASSPAARKCDSVAPLNTNNACGDRSVTAGEYMDIATTPLTSERACAARITTSVAIEWPTNDTGPRRSDRSISASVTRTTTCTSCAVVPSIRVISGDRRTVFRPWPGRSSDATAMP